MFIILSPHHGTARVGSGRVGLSSLVVSHLEALLSLAQRFALRELVPEPLERFFVRVEARGVGPGALERLDRAQRDILVRDGGSERAARLDLALDVPALVRRALEPAPGVVELGARARAVASRLASTDSSASRFAALSSRASSEASAATAGNDAASPAASTSRGTTPRRRFSTPASASSSAEGGAMTEPRRGAVWGRRRERGGGWG